MIEVPDCYKGLGYSGFFHTIATIPDQQVREAIRAKVPYLAHGWLVLAINDGGDAVMVRRDSAAVVDIFTIPPALRAL